MKNYLTLVPRYIKGQKGRYLLAAAGLVMAVALVSATGILGASLAAGYVAQVKRDHGAWHASFSSLDGSQAPVITNHARVSRGGIIRELGLARLSGKDLTVAAAEYDAAALELSGMALLKGEYPRWLGEIALEQWILKEMGLGHEPGQAVTLNFSAGDESGDEAAYILTGVLADQAWSQITGYAMAVVGGGAAGPYRVVAEFDARVDPRITGLAIQEQLGLEQDQVTFNESLLLALSDSGWQWLYLLLGLVILIATVAAIHNVFHISVLERIQQYGLLRAVGTGPRQIRRIVLGEGLLLGLIAIPVGLLAGILGTRALVSLLSVFAGTVTRIVVPWGIILWAGAICFAAVLISAWRPARMATRVSPIEAMRGTASTVREGKTPVRRWHTLLKKLCGINGLVAWRNLQRHRGQFNVTVFSMTICVVLVIVFSYYVGAADPEMVLEGQFPGEFVLSTETINQTAGYSAEDLEAIRSLKGVTGIYTTRKRAVNLAIPAGKVTAEYRNLMETFNHQVPQTGLYSSTSGLYAYSENILAGARRILTAGSIDSARMLAESEVLIINNTRGRGELVPVTTLAVGDEVTMSVARFENNRVVCGAEQTFTVAGILSDYPFPREVVFVGLSVVMHEDAFAAFTGSDIYQRIDVKVAPDADRESIETFLRNLAGQTSQGKLVSYWQRIREMEEQKRQFSLLLFSLIGVIVLISLFSIVNTISANLLLRTREFGVLRAVGMTGKQLGSTLRVEGLFYGLTSAMWGGLAGNLLAWVIYLLARGEATWLTWSPPWQATLLACAGVVLASLLATLSPLRRISGLNVIDALRQVY